MKNTKKRPKYDWFAIIRDNGLFDDFETYKFMHRGISTNRAARAFVVSSGVKFRNQSKYYKGAALVDPDCDNEGVYDSPSMKEARRKILGYE